MPLLGATLALMARLRQRLEQMYKDLGPLESSPVSKTVAGVYNALLQEVSQALAGEDLAGKGITQVSSSEDGRAVRLLVGQLVLIVGNAGGA